MRPGWRLPVGLATPCAVIILLLLASGACQADVPTAQEDCVNRNAALCELNEVSYLHNGPCPEGAKTVRPPGNEDCQATANRQPESKPPWKAISPPPPKPAPHADMARFGNTERWLLPTILIGGAALGLVLFVFLLRWLFKRRREGTMPSGTGKSLLTIVGSGAFGLFAAYQVAGLVFNHIVASYHNSDSFGPTLIASAAALLAFVVVLQFVSALTAGVLLWLFGKKPG